MPSREQPSCPAHSAASTLKAGSTWSGVSMHTNGCIGKSPGSAEGWRSVAESRHWLAGKLAVVTGASRGIGAATAEAIAATGAHVVLAARDDAALGAVAQRVRNAGGEATTAATDVSNIRDVERLFAAAGATGTPAALV